MLAEQYLTSVRIYQPKPATLATRFDTIAQPMKHGTRFSPIPQNERRHYSLKQRPRLEVLRTVQIPGAARSNKIFDQNKVLQYLGKRRLRPSMYEEGLSLAEQHPDVQREISILLAGSTTKINGRVYMACLWGDRFTRGIYLFELGTVLHCDTLHFLVAEF